MKTIIEKHVTSLLEKEIRFDKRKLDEYRKIEVEYGISPVSAEGSARVKIGNTEVVAGIKMETATPYPDTPDEGTFMANVELLPLSSPEYESGPPGIESIELARSVVDRGIRESHTLDFKKLCIKEREKSWIVMVDLYSVNDDGNLADAFGLVAFAALQDARFPKYDEKTNTIKYDEKTKKKLDLKYIPIPITVIKIGDKFIVDPTLEEERAMDARLTVTTVESGDIVALQKGGEGVLSEEDIFKMIEISIKKGKELRKFLKNEK